MNCNPPDEYLCPISQEIMNDPVALLDGSVYDRKNITKWFQNHDTSPISGLKLESKILIPMYSLK
jgi:hypothetical protein